MYQPKTQKDFKITTEHSHIINLKLANMMVKENTSKKINAIKSITHRIKIKRNLLQLNLFPLIPKDNV